MTMSATPGLPPISAWRARAQWLAIAANSFAIVMVNYWIYAARLIYMDRHPDRVAHEPPTISRAIEDPLIGEPFSFWVTISGLLLIYGVYWNAMIYFRLQARGGGAGPVLARLLTYGPWITILAQAAAALGIYLLSHYRFPDYHGWHMVGSYMFFISQVLVVAVQTVVCNAIVRGYDGLGIADRQALPPLRVLRFRRGACFASVAVTVLYLGFFALKSADLGSLTSPLYLAYVTTELIVISGFLACLALHQRDLLTRVARARA